MVVMDWGEGGEAVQCQCGQDVSKQDSRSLGLAASPPEWGLPTNLVARSCEFFLTAGVFHATETLFTPLVRVGSTNPGCLMGFVMAIGSINVFTDLL